MILEVQFQNFGARRRTCVKVFIFKIFQGAQILIFLVKICMELPLTLENKCRNAKNFKKVPYWYRTILDPWKSVFLVFEENPKKKFSFVFPLWFSFKNNRRTNVFGLLFLNTQKKSLFLKIPIKITFVRRIVFKATKKQNIKKNFFHFLF